MRWCLAILKMFLGKTDPQKSLQGFYSSNAQVSNQQSRLPSKQFFSIF